MKNIKEFLITTGISSGYLLWAFLLAKILGITFELSGIIVAFTAIGGLVYKELFPNE